MSVQVAVRVRPFNQRENELNSTLIVEMENKTTRIDHPDPKKNKEFTFDYSFWSHDGFELDETGMALQKDPKYADQRFVYESVGTQILDNAWEGYNCCLFAYGQTGAGKSYSMVGYKPNIGIIPIACQEIFKRIASNDDENITYEVFCSMQEIYNEKVQDLLIPTGKRPNGGLKIRENKTIGFYVDGLTKYPVDSYEQIEQIMDDGAKNRTIASTQMNACSSRAHTIITIEFKQITQTETKKTEKSSVINLVDLAGSEKVGKTGASGDRLKEAGQINKSLSTLGLVISSIVDQQNGKSVKVPYRDSCLTKILANALGGNSKTLMICAISPALDNYDETLSTLRYADQAKKIKNKAVINESATDKLIRELNTEIDSLKKKMELFDKLMAGTNIDVNDPKQIESFLGGGKFKQMVEVQEEMAANQHLVENANKDFKQKLVETKAMEQQIHYKKIDMTKPFLQNLNEDPLLTKNIQQSLDKEKTYIGKKNGNPVPDIILNAMGIKENHAIIHNEEGKIFIEPYDKECADYMFVNGEKVQEKMELLNLDRLIFGTNSTYLVNIPDGKPRHDDLPKDIEWEFAQEELNTKYGKKKKEEEEEEQQKQQEELQKKLQEYEDKANKEREEAEQKIREQQEEYNRKLAELEEKSKQESERQRIEKEKQEIERQRQDELQKYENEKVKKELEREKEKKKIQEQETVKKNKIKEKNQLEHRLQKILPRIVEVNLFAKELKRNVYLQAKLAQVYYTEIQNISENKQQKKLKIQVQVFNKEEGTVYLWDLNKFSNRYYIIKDLLDRYFETNEIPNLSKNEDPFWDPPEPQLIGSGFLKMLSLAYLMDSPSNITIVGDTGSQGSIQLNLIPTDETGEINIGEDMQDEAEVIEDPSELLGKRVDFLVVIDSVKLPQPFRNCFVEYQILNNTKQEETFKTEMVKEKTSDPVIEYKQQHVFEKVDEEIIDYLKNTNLCFKVYAEEEIQQENNPNYHQKGNNSNRQVIEEEDHLNPDELALSQKQLEQANQKLAQMSTGQHNFQNNQQAQNNKQGQGITQQQYQQQQQQSGKQQYSGQNKGLTQQQLVEQSKNQKGKKGKNGNCNIF